MFILWNLEPVSFKQEKRDTLPPVYLYDTSLTLSYATKAGQGRI